MPKGFNSKGYKAGGGIMTISCKECAVVNDLEEINQKQKVDVYTTPKLITLNKYRKFPTN